MSNLFFSMLAIQFAEGLALRLLSESAAKFPQVILSGARSFRAGNFE